jgi:hypothetical protein
LFYLKQFPLGNNADREERGKLVIRENDVAAAISVRGAVEYRCSANKKNIKSYFFLKLKSFQITDCSISKTGIARTTMSEADEAVRRRNAVADYRKKLLQHKELESRVRSG